MKKIVVLTVLALLIFTSSIIAEEIIVRVQDYELTREEFLETSQKMKSELDAPEEATDEDIDLYITNAIIEDFIIDSLIRIDIKERGIQVSQQEVDEELNSFLEDVMTDQELENQEEALEEIEAISGLTKEELEKEASENISFVKLQLLYFQRAQEELTENYIQSEYENYLEQTEDPVTLEEFAENIALQRTNSLLQERINYLFEENQEEIEVNI